MSKKVILVFPPFSKPALTEYAPIGICCLVSYVLQKVPNVQLKLIDYTVNKFSPREWKQELKSFKPDIVGISVITMNYPGGRLLAQLTREASSNTLIVMGGVHAVTSPEECLQDCDAVAWGDGEDTLCELVEGHNIRDIQGLTYYNNGKLVSTSARLLIKDLDSLPFPNYDRINIREYLGYPAWDIITSRGCPYNCSFCDNHIMWGRIARYRSPKNIVDELERLHAKYSITHIQFQDDMINVPQKRAFSICDEIVSRTLHKEMTFAASLRMNRQLVSQELFDRLKEANFNFLGFGVESGSQKVLDIMHKGLTPQEIREAAKMARKAKIPRLMGFIMVGNWGETVWDVMKTWHLVVTTDMETAFSVCTPFPGTEFNKLVTEAGYLPKNPNWEDCNITSVITRTDKMSKGTIFVVYVISIFLQLIFAIARGGSPRRTLHKMWWHGVDAIKRKLGK